MGTFNAGAGCRLAAGAYRKRFSGVETTTINDRIALGFRRGRYVENKNPRAAQAARGFLFGVSFQGLARPKRQNPTGVACGVLSNKSLTMTYFHRRPSTIIGAKAFHCPVRDGK
ncbi:hypothetical protein ACOTCQ_02985, partial [Achromobacter dolens]